MSPAFPETEPGSAGPFWQELLGKGEAPLRTANVDVSSFEGTSAPLDEWREADLRLLC